MTLWTRDKLIKDLYGPLHGYLSAAAVHTDLPTLVDALWSFPHDYRRRLLAAQVLSNAKTLEALEDALAVVRTLPPAAIGRDSESRGAIQGPILWQKTIERRLATGDPTLFATRPPHRTFDTHATRLIRLTLNKLMTLNKVFPTSAATGISDRIRKVEKLCRELLENHKIRDARRLYRLDPAIGAALVKRDPRLAQLEEVLRASEDAITGGSPDSLVPALIGGVLAPANDDVLFELWVGLRIIEIFRALGAAVASGPWEPGLQKNVFAHISYKGSQFTMLWQRTYWQLPFFKGTGLYQQTLTRNQIKSASSLRPDFIFYETGEKPRATIIEVKFSSRADHSPDRAGIIDCLAYLKDIEHSSAEVAVNYLVVASHTEATPFNDLICVAAPETLDATAVIDQLVGAPSHWASEAGFDEDTRI